MLSNSPLTQVESSTNVLLLTIYSNSDRNDISSAEILNILVSIAVDDDQLFSEILVVLDHGDR